MRDLGLIVLEAATWLKCKSANLNEKKPEKGENIEEFLREFLEVDHS